MEEEGCRGYHQARNSQPENQFHCELKERAPIPSQAQKSSLCSYGSNGFRWWKTYHEIDHQQDCALDRCLVPAMSFPCSETLDAISASQLEDDSHRYYQTRRSQPMYQFYCELKERATIPSHADKGSLCSYGFNGFRWWKPYHEAGHPEERAWDRCLATKFSIFCSEESNGQLVHAMQGSLCQFTNETTPGAESWLGSLQTWTVWLSSKLRFGSEPFTPTGPFLSPAHNRNPYQMAALLRH
ncbi:uncharacterized protein LOC144100761 [Amblyomma americanum]